ncbi:hypothetical protein [Umezawaea sp. NPDC059074]|uniref:hypothetical protein n=1 Tax=Umezawaea sp. NPDC059074 TaxID=3346716 RepID=UPI0036B02252
MAGADAVRSTGSLLVRALAVGGLTAAAWLIGGAVATASPGDPVPDTPSVVDIVHSAVGEHRTPFESFGSPDFFESFESFEDQRVDALAISEHWTTAVAAAPVDLSFLDATRGPAHHEDEDVAEEPEAEEQFLDVSPVYSGGLISNSTERSGTISNEMPEELYTAKVTAKAAAKLAATPAPVPAPVEVVVPVVAEVVVPAAVPAAPQWTIPALHVTAPVVEVPETAPASGLEWETPRPAAPAPAPQPAPAPTAPTASSSAHDTSGGARGGVTVTTSQSAPHQPSPWTVERRDDGRLFGSVQGLPSSPPD